MRRRLTLVLSGLFVFTGLGFAPAHASVPDGEYVCATGLLKTNETANLYAIASNVVTSHDSGKCGGAVVIPNGVTAIGYRAFHFATELTSISIPASVTSIDNEAFFGASSLRTVTFNGTSNLRTIGEGAFGLTTALPSISIPDGVTSIGFDAFAVSALTSITIPSSVVSIGSYSFASAGSLRAVTFAGTSALQSIGNYAFNRTALTSIAIPASVTTIGEYAFSEATELSSVTFSGNSNLTSIGEDAFSYTTSLTNVTFAGNSALQTIGPRAFYGATTLTSMTLPASVTSIGEYSFGATSSLTSLTFADPSSLRAVGNQAFVNAISLTSIIIPASVELMGEAAFIGSSNLVNIYFLGNAPGGGTHAFSGTHSGAKVYVTADAVDTFGGGTWNGLPVEVGVFSVAFASNGGSTTSGDLFVSGGSVAAPTAPTRAGHTFDGWSATNGGPTVSFPYNPGVAENVTLFAKWTEIPVVVTPPAGPPPAALPTVDLVAQAAAADLAARTFKSKSRFAIKPLAKRVGVQMVSPRAKVTFRVAKASRKVCTKSGTRIRTLRPGNCVVTFTVKEPRPKKGKAPRATRTVKTLVVR